MKFRLIAVKYIFPKNFIFYSAENAQTFGVIALNQSKLRMMNQDTVYITTKEGLKSALVDILGDLNINLIQATPISQNELKAPATRQDACDFLNVSIPTLHKLIKTNQIATFSIGRSVRIRWSDLEAFVNKKSLRA